MLVVRNTSSHPAVHVGVEVEGLPDGAHLVFSDNYFHLMPGEEECLTVACRSGGGGFGRCSTRLSASALNCPTVSLDVGLDFGLQF